MKGLGVFLLVVGVLGVGGGVALGMLPPELVVPGASATCESFILTVLAGAAADGLCLPTMFSLAWMVPTAVLGSAVVTLLGALFLVAGRARSLKSTLLYTRTSQGVTPSSGPSLSGSGVPVAAAAGITSNEQASYAARAGYSRSATAPLPATAVPAGAMPAPSNVAGTSSMVTPQPVLPANPASAFPTAAPQQFATPQPVVSAAPAAHPGTFIQPGAGFAPAGGAPMPADAPGGFIQPGTQFVPQQPSHVG